MTMDNRVKDGFPAPRDNFLVVAVRWFWSYPLLFVLLVHTVFSIGIWNARDGYWEETGNVAAAFRVIQSHQLHPSLYVNLIALALRYLTTDPLLAVTLMKYLSSLLATVALCLALSSFSTVLRRSAIISACLIWIASSLDAPFAQSTSLQLFAFGVMLFGICCLLRKESILALIGFYFLGLVAASIRPEYYLLILLLSVALAGRAVWRGSATIQSRLGLSRYWACGAALLLATAGGVGLLKHPPAALASKAAFLDSYALLGLGQCYAAFYHREHSQEALSPMTEYQALLDRTFNKPKGFWDAIKNNPGEVLRYFAKNAGYNVFRSLPKALLGHYREQSEKTVRGWCYWTARGILLVGGLLGARRLYRARWVWDDFLPKLPQRLLKSNSLTRKLLVLAALFSCSSVAVVLLVGTPRYFLPCVPIFYVGIAYCVDSLLKTFQLVRLEALFVASVCVCFCSPNFLIPRPNHEMDAVRHVAAYVSESPHIAASWAEPDVVLGLGGKGESVSIWDGIRRADIEDGHIDILMIDANFRNSKTWSDQRAFFERFERQPDICGFKRLVEIPTGNFEVYYRPGRR
jgi:hypothetical protein